MCDDQPFCGAEIKISTPVAFISTHAHPDAIQSKTKIAPTSWAAFDIDSRYLLVKVPLLKFQREGQKLRGLVHEF